MWILPEALVALVSFASNPETPPHVVPATAATLRADEPDWFVGPYFSARGQSQAEKKLIFIAFCADFSEWSKKLEQDTFSDAAVIAALDDLICVRVDPASRPGKRLSEVFPVRTVPIMFFVGPDGRAEDLIEGYIQPAAFLGELRRILSESATRSDLERKVAAAPNDVLARLVLADKLLELGDGPARDEQLAAARRIDADGSSVPWRQHEMQRVLVAMEANFDDAKGLYETAPLEDFLKTERHGEVLFDGWSYLGNLYSRLGRNAESRHAFRTAWATVPPDKRVLFGNSLAGGYWTMRDELKRGERKFALEVAANVCEASKAAGANDVTHAGYLDTLACCYFLNGKSAKARETIEECIRLDPTQKSYAARREAFR